MIDPKYLEIGKLAIERVHKGSNKLYIAFHNGKILDVGKVVYIKRGDLVSALCSKFISDIYRDISNNSGAYAHENWKIAKRHCKEAVEQLIKDNVIEIRHI